MLAPPPLLTPLSMMQLFLPVSLILKLLLPLEVSLFLLLLMLSLLLLLLLLLTGISSHCNRALSTPLFLLLTVLNLCLFTSRLVSLAHFTVRGTYGHVNVGGGFQPCL